MENQNDATASADCEAVRAEAIADWKRMRDDWRAAHGQGLPVEAYSVHPVIDDLAAALWALFAFDTAEQAKDAAMRHLVRYSLDENGGLLFSGLTADQCAGKHDLMARWGARAMALGDMHGAVAYSCAADDFAMGATIILAKDDGAVSRAVRECLE